MTASDDDDPKYAAGDPLPIKGAAYERLPRANKKRLLESHPTDGSNYPVGRDPRKGISKADYEACGHNRSILEAVREKCLDCCCQQPMEVRYCVATFCALWPFRMGANPFNKRELSDERRAELQERGRAMAARRRGVLPNDSKLLSPDAAGEPQGPKQGNDPGGGK